MPKAALEDRIAALEDSVRELQVAVRGRRPSADWLDKVIGSLNDGPAFEEVLAHGRAARHADWTPEDQVA